MRNEKRNEKEEKRKKNTKKKENKFTTNKTFQLINHLRTHYVPIDTKHLLDVLFRQLDTLMHILVLCK
jgi:hypothetical protein